MRDYEELILTRQESDADDCASCEYLQECRNGTHLGGCIYNYDSVKEYENARREEAMLWLRDF